MTGKRNGENKRSRSAIGRPLTSATAPPVRTSSRSSEASNATETCTSVGDGPISMIVPSTSSKRATVFKSSFAKRFITGSLAIVCTLIIPYGTRKFGRTSRVSARNDLDIAVNTGDDFEFALEDLAFITGDSAIFAFSKNYARKGADRFLDHVATGREHRPCGIGKRLAATVAHQLERDRGSAMRHGNIGQFAGLDANIGAHNRIRVAVIRHNVVSAIRHHQNIARHHAFGNRTAVAGLE